MKTSYLFSRWAALALGVSLSASFLSAQVRFPAASPHSHLKQTVGITEIEIDYARPGVKGRAIFGGLVPYGEIWRTGANASTKLTVSGDVEIGGTQVPAGTYGFYTIPEKTEWTIILSKKADLWGTYGYDESSDLVRFTVPVENLSNPVETFTIGIRDVREAGANLALEWENTRVLIPIKADPHDQVMAQLQEAMSNDEPKNPGFLFSAGNYYFTHGEDLIQAYAWVDEAIAKRADPAYWMYALKAEILVALDRKVEAVATAKEALELAKTAQDTGYVRKMEAILAENS